MRRTITIACMTVVGLVLVSQAAMAQEYALEDYMPLTVGSTWTMQVTGGQDTRTVTLEVSELMDIGGVEVPVVVQKGPDGTVRRGSIEGVVDGQLVIYGTIMGGRDGAEPRTMLYEPPAEFPGTLSVGQSAEATYRVAFRNQPTEMTMTLTLEAVETVTVPAGEFADCLKLVYATTTPRGEMRRTTWVAPGVGVIKSLNPGFGNRGPTTQELTEYQLAE